MVGLFFNSCHFILENLDILSYIHGHTLSCTFQSITNIKFKKNLFNKLNRHFFIVGLCLGGWYLLVPVLLADLFGTERISSSYGLIRMFQSVGAISVPPLAGYLKGLILSINL